MASIDLTSAAGQAAVAYQDALNQARNTQNALLRQYGFTAPGVGGEYSVEAAQRAFDPNVLFDKATGGIDQVRLQQLAGGLRMGTSGVFGEIARGGASAEAEAVLASRTAGLRGGLAEQRRRLAETQTATQTSQAQQDFLAGLGEAMAPIGGAFQRLQISQAESKALEEAAKAGVASMPATPEAPVAEPATTEGKGKPTQPGSRMYALSPNGKWRWMGTKKGWTKVQ